MRRGDRAGVDIDGRFIRSDRASDDHTAAINSSYIPEQAIADRVSSRQIYPAGGGDGIHDSQNDRSSRGRTQRLERSDADIGITMMVELSLNRGAVASLHPNDPKTADFKTDRRSAEIAISAQSKLGRLSQIRTRQSEAKLC